MKCPICKKDMLETSKDVTHNGKSGDNFKQYDKTVYNCKLDDAWIVLELPRSEINHLSA